MPKKKVIAETEINKLDCAIKYKMDCLSEGIESSYEKYNKAVKDVESAVMMLQDVHDSFYGMTELASSIKDMIGRKNELKSDPKSLVEEVKIDNVPIERKPYTVLSPEIPTPSPRETGEFICLSQDEFNQIMGRLKALELKVHMLEVSKGIEPDVNKADYD